MKKYAVLTREPRCFLGSFDFSWEQRKLGELVDRVVRKNTNNESTLPLTISAQYGLVDQITYFNNRVASRDVSNYYLVLNGEFAYNKSTSDGYPFGAVKRLDLYEKGVLSTLYIVFAPKKEQQIDSDYLTVFFDTDRWHKGVAERAAEGARNHGLLNISAEDFFDIDLSVPKDIVEQKQIGAFIRQLDNLITLHQRKCVFLFGFFQAFISMIFTASTFSWEQRKFSDVVATRRGLTYKPSDIRKNGVRVLRSSNIAEDSFVLSDEDVFVVREAVNIDCVRANDILITAANGSSRLVGKHTIISGIPEESAVHGGFMLLGTTKEPHFVNASMGSSWYRRFIELFVAGGNGAIGNLNKNDLDNQDIAIPSEKEQKKIGSFFRQLDNLITLHQRECISFTARAGRRILTANKKRNTSSWEQRKLGDIADIVGGGTPSTGNQSYWDGDIDWYAPAEIADQIYANSSQKKITGLGYENSSAKMLPPGTVLFTSRAGIGKTAILTRKGCTNQGFQSIVPHRGELDSYFIFSRTEELKRYGELAGAGSTFVEVSGKQMAVMELMMPPTMREQQTIGGFFQQLDHLITLHQRKPFLMKWRTSDANRNKTNRLVL
jgi:type I restriction enzyme S subunit